MQRFTKRSDFPEHLPTTKTFFCSLCGATDIQKVIRADGTATHHCNSCGGDAERFLGWNPGMAQFFNEAGELVHESVGVIVQNPQREILLFKRIKYPFLWTIPAGHRDIGEDPLLAAARELREETAIVADELQELFVGEIRGDSCVGGVDIHFWYAYLYHMKGDMVPVIEAEEGAQWGWFAPHDMPQVTLPVKYLISQTSVKELL